MNETEAREYLRLSPTDELSPADVKRAYRAAAKLHHPDVGEQPDVEQFRLATEAAQLLAAGGRARPSSFDRIHTAMTGDAAPRTNRASRRVPYNANMDDVIDAMRTSVDEIFGNMQAERERRTVTVSHVNLRDEIWLTDLPEGAVVVIEGRTTAFRVETADGQPMSIRHDG